MRVCVVIQLSEKTNPKSEMSTSACLADTIKADSIHQLIRHVHICIIQSKCDSLTLLRCSQSLVTDIHCTNSLHFTSLNVKNNFCYINLAFTNYLLSIIGYICRRLSTWLVHFIRYQLRHYEYILPSFSSSQVLGQPFHTKNTFKFQTSYCYINKYH